jgi:hypothetical protein
MLRRVFGPRNEEDRGGWIRIHEGNIGAVESRRLIGADMLDTSEMIKGRKQDKIRLSTGPSALSNNKRPWDQQKSENFLNT